MPFWSARLACDTFRGPLMADLRSVSTTGRRREDALPLRQELKRETADLHRRLEIDLGLLEAELSLDRYRRVLEFFFGFYAPSMLPLRRGWRAWRRRGPRSAYRCEPAPR